MADQPQSPDQLAAIEATVAGWLAGQLAENPVVAAVDHDPAERRWHVRIHGEDKDVYTVWFTLGQRTLHYETYFMPAPEEQSADCYAQLLRRNQGLYGLAFSVGAEEAIFLSGQLGNDAIDADELDRILGTFYATVEQCFRSALRLGFPSRFK